MFNHAELICVLSQLTGLQIFPCHFPDMDIINPSSKQTEEVMT